MATRGQLAGSPGRLSDLRLLVVTFGAKVAYVSRFDDGSLASATREYRHMFTSRQPLCAVRLLGNSGERMAPDHPASRPTRRGVFPEGFTGMNATHPQAAQQPYTTYSVRNGFGITALVLALVGAVFGIVPLTGFIALILGGAGRRVRSARHRPHPERHRHQPRDVDHLHSARRGRRSARN